MPLILTKRKGSCTACGGYIAKGEEAYFTAATGLRHPEARCSQASSSEHRENRHPSRCECGTMVPRGQGRLVHLGEKQNAAGAWEQLWAVRCRRCS